MALGSNDLRRAFDAISTDPAGSRPRCGYGHRVKVMKDVTDLRNRRPRVTNSYGVSPYRSLLDEPQGRGFDRPGIKTRNIAKTRRLMQRWLIYGS